MKAFLTGATGFVGGHVLEMLVEAGADRPMSRQVGQLHGKPRRDRCRGRWSAIFVTPSRFASAISGCDAVFHCAADYRLFAKDSRELYESNVEGTRNVLRAAAELGVRKVVYTSSVGALGSSFRRIAGGRRHTGGAGRHGGSLQEKQVSGRTSGRSVVCEGTDVIIVNPSTPVGERDSKPTATGKMIRRLSQSARSCLRRDRVEPGRCPGCSQGHYPGSRERAGRDRSTFSVTRICRCTRSTSG